jgi:hypothetical protein
MGAYHAIDDYDSSNQSITLALINQLCGNLISMAVCSLATRNDLLSNLPARLHMLAPGTSQQSFGLDHAASLGLS